jgi:hypothetical protein
MSPLLQGAFGYGSGPVVAAFEDVHAVALSHAGCDAGHNLPHECLAVILMPQALIFASALFLEAHLPRDA